ncbi:MocR-like pyridoxine biosynthesis transcription factor PdxR [Metabacillus niabensis]|uniref:GntR family transcriptional regulator/MocR family aminotransferase n=1 Tax=Metabacillus niabensis TaxID=324854 RepID=A0ABT9Z0N2_9BACI|nr:PLP-dependent aminotransferase family protein [Metabacillus niabensis]MDQ0225820.1 GntR family transcriptional regulator/MocR family aminotransferase [Metabacillus niabensis]
MIELTPYLNRKDNTPLYIQLANYIKQEIVCGRIKPGERLPSKRKLSSYLGLSLNTIQTAYEQLNAEGYIESKPRKGIFVTAFENELSSEEIAPKQWEQVDNREETINFDFNSGNVDIDHFPYSLWRKITIQSLYEDQGELFQLGNPQGELPLREEIAKHLYASRGVRCQADQIIIGAGTQMLIALLVMLIGKDNLYGIENPGFHRIKAVMHNLGAKTVPIPLERDGIEINQLIDSEAKVVYVTPSHQFPNGMIMPISRRLELLKWAEMNNGFIIEDDYDGEYRYKGQPIPSLQGLDTKGRVIYLGTFSKSLIPSIRISYIVLPPSFIHPYQESFTIYKQTASRLHQETLYRFMKEGYFQSHLNKMRTLYRKKHGVLMLSIKRYFGNKVKVIGENSGLHIVLEVKNRMSEEELIKKALKAGVKVYPLSIYYDGVIDSSPQVLLGFGGLREAEIDTGISLLKDAWEI